jgi:nitrate/nitrite-specific signal transduction histidine kinase
LLELQVEDHGVGMPLESQANSRGMGMIAMRERAQLLGGKIEFLRPEAGGTLVRLHVPLRPSPNELPLSELMPALPVEIYESLTTESAYDN